MGNYEYIPVRITPDDKEWVGKTVFLSNRDNDTLENPGLIVRFVASSGVVLEFPFGRTDYVYFANVFRFYIRRPAMKNTGKKVIMSITHDLIGRKINLPEWEEDGFLPITITAVWYSLHNT